MENDTRLMSMVDERSKLAGSNKMELLLFALGGREIYGINVFKVREVCEALPITVAPRMPRGVKGLISLRGSIMPVVDLSEFLGIGEGEAATKLIITEISGQVQAFLVKDVDRIVRVDWDHVRAPQPMLAAVSSRITAVTELEGGRLVSILDVEQILGEVMGETPVPPIERAARLRAGVFFADDSALARRKIVEVLDGLGVAHHHATNGREAWEKLQGLATRGTGAELKKNVGLILVDAEMPEMDGYVLTRHIKGDRRFEGIPVVMHSSLSSTANRKLGEQVGVDAYVAKFHPDVLADTIRGMLAAA
jgi:two-component system chemotaxis response regulator CheV